MSDSLAEQERKRQHMFEEKDWLMRLLKERADEWHANRGGQPEIVVKESSLQIGRFTMYFELDQVPDNPTAYGLVIKVGVEANPFFGPLPTPERRRFRALESNDRRSIVWVESSPNPTQFETEELAVTAFNMFIDYYRKHKPN